MTFDLDTILTITVVQSLLLSAAILTRESDRPEAWLLVGMVGSGFCYIAYKLGYVGGPGTTLHFFAGPVLASETLPGALIIAYTVNTLFELSSRRVYLVFLLPLLEVAVSWVTLIAAGVGAAPHLEEIFVRIGQVAIFVAGGFAVWLARRHFLTYENQSADNQRFVAYLLILPAVGILLLNGLWLLTEMDSVVNMSAPSVDAAVVAMIAVFQLWLVTFLVAGASPGHKPSFELSSAVDNKSTVSADRTQADFERICAVLDAENLHLDSELSLEKLSRKAGMNRSRVSAAINAQSELSFSTLINQLRVERAKRLLSKTELTVIEVAFDAGFSSKSTFNRVFKDITGETPLAWRSRSRIT